MVFNILRIVFIMIAPDEAKPTCCLKTALTGFIIISRKSSTYFFIQKLKFSFANVPAERVSESGLKKIPAAMMGNSHRRLSQFFNITVLSTCEIVAPRANKRATVININGHFESILNIRRKF